MATRKQETRKEQEGADWGPIRTEEFVSWRPKEVKDVYGRGSQGGGEGPTLQQERNCQECSDTFISFTSYTHITIFFPVNFEAKLIFTPLLPTAFSRPPSSKIATQYFLSSSIYKSIGFAGERALVINTSDFSV